MSIEAADPSIALCLLEWLAADFIAAGMFNFNIVQNVRVLKEVVGRDAGEAVDGLVFPFFLVIPPFMHTCCAI